MTLSNGSRIECRERTGDDSPRIRCWAAGKASLAKEGYARAGDVDEDGMRSDACRGEGGTADGSAGSLL